ncbi:DUF1553 domain-containing protein [Dyadobacter sandarakinus]|uniref:DUF1553 domain-containing protein n=1 Tax=Dyadobacter sandarakinus TaxID=2747268 RepID=A0ABX7I2N2_9BACT|nr:DUF1553 domain-containing protein [Dyadobacter sandarakinus]QRR00334.1 DUF1553 domain-containing protein [Dyadobacter sandarakinus]
MRWLLLSFFCLSLFSCGPSLPDDVALAMDELPETLDYNLHVKPVLSDKCFACHGPDKAKQKAGLRLDVREAAYANLPEHSGKVAIDPGKLRNSEVFRRIISDDPDYVMPTPDSHLSLTPKEKAVLIRWIEEGAEYKPHWAFVKPEKKKIPQVQNERWPRNAIDYFVLAKLDQEKMVPSPEADRETLLRRLSLDLTGLPPTMAETDNFLKDQSEKAYEKQVDRLLASPHYGEKMAVDWLDLARFADSHGYTVDRLRDMSPYRDWVINAFNRNMRYDRFIHWQLAGDLMPAPTRDMRIATAFNRNHQQNVEGGIIEEEFQTEYVVDRTNTFGDAMLGLSVGCAKCHDHKYDPISQKNYYQLFSFFNNVKEAGQISWDDALPTPTLLLPTPQQERMLKHIRTLESEQQVALTSAAQSAQKDFEKWKNSEAYHALTKQKLPATGLVALYNFDSGTLRNSVNPRQNGIMKRESGQTGDQPELIQHDAGKALAMNGDVFLDLDKVGVFRKSETFTIGIRTWIPAELDEGVIFHKSLAERLYNFRGFHLYLKKDRLELNMAHTAPSNAITRLSARGIPRNRWIHLTMTYDGSSRAAGMRLFVDGSEMPLETTMDQLTKDILFKMDKQPGLQVGGWWRGKGFKGGRVDDLAVYNRSLSPLEVRVLAGKESWENILAPGHVDQQMLQEYYWSAVSPVAREMRTRLRATRTMLADSAENLEELMVMQEMSRPKPAFLLLRGSYDAPGERVYPATPAAIAPFPAHLPKNRYGLALWLTGKDHPLTARVAVNRFWQNFFGTGIVKTTEDFGNQGELPSHPELLDWLAVTFRESGWNVKALNKMIVMSAAYRQQTRANRTQREKDPENRLLARGPSGRLTAEMLRDNALMASGLLDMRIGGKSVKPYQPDGLWEINNTTYQADTGRSVYRRSLYVLVKRSVPNPTLGTFDATSRSFCVVRRQKTNTPLQALVTLNDPTFNEAMKVMGEQMTRMGSGPAAITAAYRKLTGTRPAPAALKLLLAMQHAELEKFRKNPAKTAGWLKEGQYQVDKHLDKAAIAANAVVASTILNSDAALTRR